jgi:hypothetical protein
MLTGREFPARGEIRVGVQQKQPRRTRRRNPCVELRSSSPGGINNSRPMSRGHAYGIIRASAVRYQHVFGDAANGT